MKQPHRLRCCPDVRPRQGPSSCRPLARFGAAPRSRSSRTFAGSPAAHIRAVEPNKVRGVDFGASLHQQPNIRCPRRTRPVYISAVAPVSSFRVGVDVSIASAPFNALVSPRRMASSTLVSACNRNGRTTPISRRHRRRRDWQTFPSRCSLLNCFEISNDLDARLPVTGCVPFPQQSFQVGHYLRRTVVTLRRWGCSVKVFERPFAGGCHPARRRSCRGWMPRGKA